VTDSTSPWQNGRTDRHGAWVKQRMEEEVQSVQTILRSSKELETMPPCPKRQNVWMGLSSKVKAIGSRRLTDRSSYFMTQSQI